MTSLRVSTPEKEGVYQGSKYLKFHVLCSAQELEKLFHQLSPFWIYRLTGLSDAEPIGQDRFLAVYDSWIEGLKQGNVPTDAALKELLACAFTADLEALWKQPVPGNRFLVKVAKPLVQVQAHFFTYSPIDGVFRPMTMGSESIFWGLQFAFPQIYQDPKTMELREVEESENAQLFQKIKQWVKDETRPTPFLVEGQKINVPIRLGKSCFSWIFQHPQLTKVKVYAN